MQEMFKLSVTAIIKDEADYLDEWLAYHILLGFEHFYLFDNGSTDSTAEVLAPYIKYGYVTHLFWPIFPGQMDAYGYAVRIFGPHTRWMAFIDIDEFIVLKSHQNVGDFLDEVTAEQLLVFWKIFGHAGFMEKPEGLVIENFTKCDTGLSSIVKCIVRPESVYRMFVHNCVTKNNKTVNDAGVMLREDWKQPDEFKSEKFICLNHYFTRSYSEYRKKILRGQADGRTEKKLEPFETWDYIHTDHSMAVHAPRVKEFLLWFRALPDQPLRYGSLSAVGQVSNPRNFALLTQKLAQEFTEQALSSCRIMHNFFGSGLQFDDETPVVDSGSVVDSFLDTFPSRLPATTLFLLTDANADQVSSANETAVSAYKCPIIIERSNEASFFQVPAAESAHMGYVICLLLMSTPADALVDFIVLGKDDFGQSTSSKRRIEIKKGMHLGAYMINDTPLYPDCIRIHPRAVLGQFKIFRLHCLLSH